MRLLLLLLLVVAVACACVPRNSSDAAQPSLGREAGARSALAPPANTAPTAAANQPSEPELTSKPRLRADVVVTGGVHGNEPSGNDVLPQLAEAGFVTFGPCNPWGIRNNQRHLEDGLDLNRLFSDAKCPEVAAVHTFLADHKPGLLLDLHEDPDGTNPYLIQSGPEDDLGRRILDRLKGEYEFEAEPRWAMLRGKDGLLQPTRQVLGLQRLSGVYSLAYYAWLTYGCTAITVECPGSWPAEKRRAWQVRVCTLAREIFSELHPPE